MKAPPFLYAAPDSVEAAIAVLAEHGDEAKLLAGGQSLIPLLNFRLSRPEVAVDINRIPGLDGISRSGNVLRIGALARHRAVEQMSGLRERCRLIPQAVGHIGHVAIRNRGTVGGSLAHADPAAEWGLVGEMLDGVCTVAGPRGERRVRVTDLQLGYLTTTLEPDEMITSVDLALPPAGSGMAFAELARRHGDFALAGAAAIIRLDGSDAIAEARVGLLGLAPTALRVPAAEDLLQGQPPGPDAFAAAAEAAVAAAEPASDLHGSADYRLRLARVLTTRVLTAAAADAAGADGADGRKQG